MNAPESPIPYADIPPDREDGSSSFVHRTLILTGQLGTLSPWLLLPLWLGLTYMAARLWGQHAFLAAASFAILLALDWIMLQYLPRTARSWGPVTPPLLGLALVHVSLFGLGRALMPWPPALGLTLGVNFLLTAVAFYATWIEPFRVTQTSELQHVQSWGGGRIVTALHISDIHFERSSPRERQLLELLDQHRPDLLLLTGDYLNLSSVYDPKAHAGARGLLSQFEAPLGVYAVTGSPTVDIPSVVPGVFEGLPIHWLDDEAVKIQLDGDAIWVLGIRNTYNDARDALALRKLAATTPRDAYRILLYHTPDLMPVAVDLEIDLYLCGHTHGGQIAAPIYGALTTGSRWGKRYEKGRHQEANTTLYVSRGLGLEGLGAPRARFLAPPEVVQWRFCPSPEDRDVEAHARSLTER